MADNPLTGLATDLGFGEGLGGMLRRQQVDETEEMKRKRRLGLINMPVPGSAGQLGPGAMALFGGMSGKGY